MRAVKLDVVSRLQFTKRGMAHYIVEAEGHSFDLQIPRRYSRDVDELASDMIQRFFEGDSPSGLELLE